MRFLNWLFSDASWVLSGNLSLSAERLAARPSPPGWLRGHTVLLDLGWFSFLPDDLLRRSVEAGRPVFKVRAPDPGAAPASAVSLDESYRGIPLRALCEYELCVAFDCMPDDLDGFGAHPQVGETIGRGKDLVDWANAVLDYFDPSRVVYPQGYVLPAAALRLVALQRGLPVLALENTFRKDRFCWDDRSGITLATPVPMEMFRASSGSGDVTYFNSYQEAARGLKSAEHSTRRSAQPPSVEARKILFIGQVNSDSSVLFHLAPGFPAQMDAASCVAEFVLRAPDTAMMLKVHPKEVHGTNPLGRRYSLDRYSAFKERYADRAGQRIITDDEASFDILDAIAWADICVTINSQAGLEAAAMGKPVILCGEAPYERLRSVRSVRDCAELQAALADRIPTTEAGEARAFFEFYCERYARPATATAFLDHLAEGQEPAAVHPFLRLALWLRYLKRALFRR